MNDPSDDQSSSRLLLNSMERTLYSFQRRSIVEELNNNNNLLILSWALKLLGIKVQPLRDHPGTFFDLLEQNDIYHRAVALPENLAKSEYQLLILFGENDSRPYLLSRTGHLNQVLSVLDGQIMPIIGGLPVFQDRAIEVYPMMPPNLSRPLDVLRFTYRTEVAPIIALGLISLVVVAFSLLIPILTDTLVSRVLPETDYLLLLESLVVVSLIIIASVTSQYLQGLMTLRLETISDLRLQTALWDRLTKLPLLFIRSYTIGDLNSRVTAIFRIRSLINADSLTRLLAALFSFSFFILMLYYNTQLALWTGVLVFLIYRIIFLLARSSIAIQDRINPIMARISNFAYYSVCGLPQIRSLGSEAFILNRWLGMFTEYAGAYLRSNALDQLIVLLTDLLGTVGSLLMFIVVVIQVLAFPADFSSSSSIASFIAFYAAFIAFCAAVSSATSTLSNVYANVASLWKRCEPIIYEPVEPGYGPEAIYQKVEGNYSISSLSFQFPGRSQKTFDNLNFEIKAGSYVAITGPSGAGKSTLIKLITGLLPPSSGEILVDNIPLRKLAIRAYRRQLGIVIQDARLDNGTILEVVRAGRTDPDTAVWNALEMACIAKEIERLPLGIHTQIINGGSNISGGQRQRLALARALLPQPRVLLLDEATSAIDNISQQAISDAIDGLGITRIAIAHRLSTLRNADQVLVIENGSISQRGSFNELLQQDGYLRRMMAMESRSRG
jgi:ATP-binding cassette subfamily B protein